MTRGIEVLNSSAMSLTWQLFLCSKKLMMSCLVSISIADRCANCASATGIADGCFTFDGKYLRSASGVCAGK